MSKPIKEIQFGTVYYSSSGEEVIFYQSQDNSDFVCVNRTTDQKNALEGKIEELESGLKDGRLILFATLLEAKEFSENEARNNAAETFWRNSRIEYNPTPQQIVLYFRKGSVYDLANLGYEVAGRFFDNSEEGYKHRLETIKIYEDSRKASYLLKDEMGDILREGIDAILGQLRINTLPKELSTKEFLVYSLRCFYRILTSDKSVVFAKDLKIAPKEKEDCKQKYIKERKIELEPLLECIDYIEKNYDFKNHNFSA